MKIVEAQGTDLSDLIQLYEQLDDPPAKFGSEDVASCERIFSQL